MRILQAGGNFMFDHQISRFRIKAFLCLMFEGKTTILSLLLNSNDSDYQLFNRPGVAGAVL